MASCVLTTINDVKFIFTAAHVMRKDGFRNSFNQVPVGMGTPAGRMVSLEKLKPIFSCPLSDGRDLDIGLIRLEPETCGQLQSCHFLPTSNWERDHKDDRSGDSIYLLIGYPGSRKMTEIRRGQVKQRSICICTYPASPWSYTKLNLPGADHILFEYDERNVSQDGMRRNPPALGGVSGGGIFCVHKETGNTRLVGIISEFHKESGLIVGTRIDAFFWTAAVYTAVPDLATLLERKP